MQAWPFPLYPFRHWQLKEPSVLVHVACVEQVEDPSVHSLISKTQLIYFNILDHFRSIFYIMKLKFMVVCVVRVGLYVKMNISFAFVSGQMHADIIFRNIWHQYPSSFFHLLCIQLDTDSYMILECYHSLLCYYIQEFCQYIHQHLKKQRANYFFFCS